MKNSKLILVIIPMFLFGAFLLYKFSPWGVHQQQVSLAKELRKAISATMLDLSQAKSSSIEGIPADGQWYHFTSFDTHQYGKIGYSINNKQLMRKDVNVDQVISKHVKEFNLRRKSNEPMIVDVKIVLKEGIILSSNFRVRLQE